MRKISQMTKVAGRVTSVSGLALILAASNLVTLLPKNIAAASGETISGDTSDTTLVATPTVIGNLHITASGNPNESVRLFVSHGDLSMTTTTGLTFTTATTGGQLEFNGLLSDVNVALATLHYSRSSLGNDTLEMSLVGPGEVYDPITGHIYKFVDESGNGGIDWPDAKAAADAMTSHGLTGYLATMTSSQENDYIAARLPDAGWMGASDAATEGDWKWVDGPESGQSFYSGVSNLGLGTTGTAVNGAYNNWNVGEPNDSGGNEDCGQFLSGSSGQWNDLPCDSTALLAGYVVEFGGPGQLPSIAYKNVALSTVGNTVTAANCAQLQSLDAAPGSEFDTIKLTANIDCTGYTVNPLFSNGFHGTFDGQGHTISNVDLNHPSDSQVGLFSSAYDATIKNVKLTSGQVRGNNDVGGVVGYSERTNFENVSSDWSILACQYYCGGFAGELYVVGSTNHIYGSSSSGAVTGYSAGGLIGYLDVSDGGDFTIEQTAVTGNVSGMSYGNGGLIGYADNDAYSSNSHLTIQDVYTHSDVDGSNQSSQGGLVGYLNTYGSGVIAYTTIQRVYTSGHISGSDQVGGLVGYLGANSGPTGNIVFRDNFSASMLTSNDPTTTGGLIGENDATSQLFDQSHNYFDTTRAGTADCSGSGGTALSSCTAIDTTAQPDYFKNNHTNRPMSAWDFTTIWKTNLNDYPTFGQNGSDDNDGISSTVENAAPNGGDANDDGTPDAQQANVASFIDTQSGKYAVLAVPSACTINGVSSLSESANSVHDSGFNYPAGLMNFNLSCGTPGYSATITQYYYGAVASSYAVRKYDPRTHAYYSVPGASVSHLTIGGQPLTKVSYQVTDGSSLDTDGTVNGVIVDPSGLGVAMVGVPNTGLGGSRR